jgi:hypothetical protein
MTTKRLTLPEAHSAKQQEIIEWQGHGVAFCGRRYGKTQAAVIKLVVAVLSRPGLYFWVGLSWRSASLKRAERLLQGYCRQVWRALGENPESRIRISDHEIIFPNGGVVWMRTADNPASLAGEGVMGAVLDEFSLMPESVWTEFVAASLLDYGGWALLTGVPKGMNWASRLWMQAKTRPGWKAWQCSSYDNPTLNKEAIDELASGLPERLRRQEIYAEVIDDAGAVFRKVSDLATAVGQESAIEGHLYVCGVDWGRSHDATVFSVVDVTLQHLVYVDRMVGVDYELQIGRLKALSGKFKLTKIVCEVNAMGQPLFERLQKDGLPVVPFTTTNATKQLIIDALTMAFEREDLHILPDETLIGELQAYEMETLPSGIFIRYGAPTGMYDDHVISLALAWHAVSQSATAGRVVHGHVKNRGGGGYYRKPSPWRQR